MDLHIIDMNIYTHIWYHRLSLHDNLRNNINTNSLCIEDIVDKVRSTWLFGIPRAFSGDAFHLAADGFNLRCVDLQDQVQHLTALIYTSKGLCLTKIRYFRKKCIAELCPCNNDTHWNVITRIICAFAEAYTDAINLHHIAVQCKTS